MRWRWRPSCVVMLKDCFMRPSGLYLYPSGPSPSPSSESPFCDPPALLGPEDLLGPAAATAAAVVGRNPLVPRLPSISRYVRKLPDTLLALHDLPSVHLLIPASRSSHTNTDPDLICDLSFSDSRRCTRGSRPKRQASNSIMASCGVRTWPL